VAVWGSRLAATGNYTSHSLFAVDVAARTGIEVASGIEIPGGAAFSSDAARVAMLFGERLYVAPVPGASAAAAAR
jgi:hypothetical protein